MALAGSVLSYKTLTSKPLLQPKPHSWPISNKLKNYQKVRLKTLLSILKINVPFFRQFYLPWRYSAICTHIQGTNSVLCETRWWDLNRSTLKDYIQLIKCLFINTSFTCNWKQLTTWWVVINVILHKFSILMIINTFVVKQLYIEFYSH